MKRKETVLAERTHSFPSREKEEASPFLEERACCIGDCHWGTTVKEKERNEGTCASEPGRGRHSSTLWVPLGKSRQEA